MTHPVLDPATLQTKVTRGTKPGYLQLSLTDAGVYGLNVLAKVNGDSRRLHHVHAYLVRYEVPDDVIHEDEISPGGQLTGTVKRRSIHSTVTTDDQVRAHSYLHVHYNTLDRQ